MESSARSTSAVPNAGAAARAVSFSAAGLERPSLEPVLDLAREWTAGPREALVLSGSHAAGAGVWCAVGGRVVALSDVDVYAIMADEASARAARARVRAAGAGLAAKLLALGFAAPLEVGVLSLTGLERQPARPGTIELGRRGRVVDGDPGALRGLPSFGGGDVSREETLLLLENRGFELLIARPALAAGDALARLRARHATLKAAADLAGVLALRHGEWPEGARARIDWARAHALPLLEPSAPPVRNWSVGALESLWRSALAWREGDVELPPVDEAMAEWEAAASAWAATWWHLHEGGPRDPWARALRVAARAPVRRRMRQAVAQGAAVPLAARLRSACRGTPQHRIHGSAAVLLLAAASSAGAPALPAGALRALRVLGVTAAADWEGARSQVLRAWDHGLLDGLRTGEDDA